MISSIFDVFRAAPTKLWDRAVAANWFGPTARKYARREVNHAERRAEHAEARLRAAIDALPQGVVFLDDEGRYILWNQRYAELYHRSADLFEVGAKLSDTLRIGVERGDYPDAIGCEEEWLAERMARLTNPGTRHEQRVSDGRWLMIEERRTADGGIIGLRVDITEMKQQAEHLRLARDQAEEATRAKSRFLATMSHEIRTPLNGVLGMAQAMANDELSPRQRERLGVIHKSGEALLSILNDILDISKIEAGKLEIETVSFDLEEAVVAIHSIFEGVAAAKNVDLLHSIEEDAVGAYLGDPMRLRQILMNLLSNALKFTERGSVRLDVSTIDGTLQFVVRDSGIGMTPDQLANLFQKFTQADVSTTRKYGGTGLGLAICQELAALMGGTLDAVSTLDEGSTFTLRLPLERCEAPASAPAAAAVEKDQHDDLRVLVAEDNAVNQLVLKTLLAQAGVEPVVVDNGVQAVEAWSRAEWDVILMDVQMPQMDGLMATQEIRTRERIQGRSRTPIIALTANAMAHQVREYLEAGMDGFVAKPIEAAKLFDAMEQALAVSAPQASEPTLSQAH